MDYSEEMVEIQLPRQIVERVKNIIEKHGGLFEDEQDYITHCIIHYNRDQVV